MKQLVLFLLFSVLPACQAVPSLKTREDAAPIASTKAPQAAMPELPSHWLFYGDSQTGGRGNIESTASPAAAFERIWRASGFDGPASVRVSGRSGRSLAQTADELLSRN